MIIWLASYPRSGNTLLRTILWKCYGLPAFSKYNDISDIEASADTAAAIGHRHYEGDWPAAYDRFSSGNAVNFVKTHEAPEDSAPAIYVVRNGHAAVMSNKHYWADFAGRNIPVEDLITGRAGPFCSWGSHLDAWNPFKRPRTLLLRYEELVNDASSQIKEITKFIGRPPSVEWVNDFASYHRLNPRFFRSGKTEVSKRELTSAQVLLHATFHADWMFDLGYSGKRATEPDLHRYLRNIVMSERAIESIRRESQEEMLSAIRNCEGTVNEQRNYISILELERDQLATELTGVRETVTKDSEQNQLHITDLRQQLDRVAATSVEQAVYIASLEKERDRLATELTSVRETGTRLLQENQLHITDLRQQLDHLAATSVEQAGYIASLKKECDRLGSECRESLKELDRVLTDGQRHIDILKGQLDALAETSREQDKYILILKEERERLRTSEAQAIAECSCYVKTIGEQTTYIRILEGQLGARIGKAESSTP